MKKIYLIRHGESQANIDRIHGDAFTPLTEKGHSQAEFIAERCKKLPLEKLVVSTMTRARETAQHVSEATGLVPEYSDLFVETLGPSKFKNVPYDDPEAKEFYGNIVREHYGEGWRYEDEENFDDHKARAAEGLEFLLSKPEEHIGVVMHGVFMRLLVARAIFGPEVSAREFHRMRRGLETENTGLTVLRYDETKEENLWQLWVWNDHAHLG